VRAKCLRQAGPSSLQVNKDICAETRDWRKLQ
jgi:hypothetical protein